MLCVHRAVPSFCCFFCPCSPASVVCAFALHQPSVGCCPVHPHHLPQGGWAVAIFHTAGKGTRLAPLPGSENNNKPGVKLVSTMTIGREKTELTILEAVIRQTNSYAPYRKGRCSVFWGDQIFVPSAGPLCPMLEVSSNGRSLGL